VVDTVLVDQETVYAPRQSNDCLLLGLKGSLNEYELELLRQRSLEARREKAKRGELIVAAPEGYRKTEDQRLEKDPDLRVQEAIRLVFRQFVAIGSVRQTLLWFLEHADSADQRRHRHLAAGARGRHPARARYLLAGRHHRTDSHRRQWWKTVPGPGRATARCIDSIFAAHPALTGGRGRIAGSPASGIMAPGNCFFIFLTLE
jgi:hypothetical protein